MTQLPNEPPEATPPKIANRIVSYGTKPASQFQGNPQNWRVHPPAQRQALAGVLESVGWAAPVIESARTGILLDGHERVWQALQAGDVDIPFVTVDVSENEERILLTTLDPIGAMAETDREALASLMADVQSDDARVQELIAGIAERENVVIPDEPTAPDGFKEYDENISTEHTCPKCGYKWSGGE